MIVKRADRTICVHRNVYPCWLCHARSIVDAVLWLLACIAVCAAAAGAWVALAAPAHCQGSYCGPCAGPPATYRACPYGCACFTDGFCHQLQDDDDDQ